MSRPPLPVRTRRAWRLFRAESPLFQGLAAVATLVLVVGVGSVLAHPSSRGTATVSSTTPGDGSTALPGPGGLPGPSSTAKPGAGKAPGAKGSPAPGASNGSGSVGGSTGPGGGPSVPPVGTGVGPGGVKLTASDRGVTSTSVKVVFPWPQLTGVSQATGAIFSSEDEVKSIHAAVDYINRSGGINGRKILPEIVQYDPQDENDMRAKCQDWTLHQKVFAVVDAIAWHDANQLCITEEGHTPLLTSYAESTSYLRKGAPNLWWTSPDGCNVIRDLVGWAVSTKQITSETHFGVVTSDSDADQAGINECLKPALARVHLTPADTETLHYDINDPGAAAPGVPGAIARLKLANVTVVLPLVSFFPYTSYIQGERSAHYYPKLLLSDFDDIISTTLIQADTANPDPDHAPAPVDQATQDMAGPTFSVYGSTDYEPYEGPLGHDCNKAWHVENPGTDPIESTGVAMRWCQNVRLFAHAATLAGPELTRDGFNRAMAAVTSFPGGTVKDLRFGQGVYAGPHLRRIVAVHENQDHKCKIKRQDGTDHGSCWQVLSGWHEQTLA